MMPRSTQPDVPSRPVPGWKRLFFRGLILLLPTIITLIVLLWGFGLINDNIIHYVNASVQVILKKSGFHRLIEGSAILMWFFDYALGFILTLVFIGLVGVMVGTLLGKRVWAAFESRVTQVPLVRYVYPFIREVTDVVFTGPKAAFSSVVIVEYPRKGIWSLGFVTGQGIPAVEAAARKKVVTVFLPASPTPMTGYIIFVPEDEVARLDISVDDAFRLIMSGGVIVPGMPKPDAVAHTEPKPPISPAPGPSK